MQDTEYRIQNTRQQKNDRNGSPSTSRSANQQTSKPANQQTSTTETTIRARHLQLPIPSGYIPFLITITTIHPTKPELTEH